MNDIPEMSEPYPMVNLSAALVAASAEMPMVPFDQNNPFIGNRFASLGAVIAVARPILAKHGLAIMQFACSDERSRVGVRTRLIHSSGEYLEETIYMEIFEDKDSRKSKAQVAGSIITYLRRYAQSALLNLYADEDTDGNAPGGAPVHPERRPSSTPAALPKTAATVPGATGGAKGSAPPNPEKCKARFLMVVAERKLLVPAWMYALDKGWIMPSEKIEDARADRFPTTAEAFDAIIAELEGMAMGPSDQASFDAAYRDDSEAAEPAQEFGLPKRQSEAWRSLLIPKWSNNFKEDGLETFGQLDKKQLWWWCVQWKPAGFKGKPPKQEDMALRAELDKVKELYGFTESKR